MKMRKSVKWLMFALVATAIFGGSLIAQPPPGQGKGKGGKGGGPGGPGGAGGPGGRGPGGGFERAIDDMNLTTAKHDAVLTAFRTNQDNVDRLTNLAGSELMLKLKEILAPEEYKALKEATDKVRVGAAAARTIQTDDLVEHILSFDKTKKGSVSKDELPERMQYLIEKGDLNKDGILDREEIKKLAIEMAKDTSSTGGRGGPGGGRGGPGGRAAQVTSPASGLTLTAIDHAANDLKLPEQKKERVASIVKEQKEQARKLTTLVHAELLLEVSEILSPEEYAKAKTIIERGPAVGERPGGLRPGGPQGGPGGRGPQGGGPGRGGPQRP